MWPLPLPPACRLVALPCLTLPSLLYYLEGSSAVAPLPHALPPCISYPLQFLPFPTIAACLPVPVPHGRGRREEEEEGTLAIYPIIAFPCSLPHLPPYLTPPVTLPVFPTYRWDLPITFCATAPCLGPAYLPSLPLQFMPSYHMLCFCPHLPTTFTPPACVPCSCVCVGFGTTWDGTGVWG